MAVVDFHFLAAKAQAGRVSTIHQEVKSGAVRLGQREYLYGSGITPVQPRLIDEPARAAAFRLMYPNRRRLPDIMLPNDSGNTNVLCFSGLPFDCYGTEVNCFETTEIWEPSFGPIRQNLNAKAITPLCIGAFRLDRSMPCAMRNHYARRSNCLSRSISEVGKLELNLP